MNMEEIKEEFVVWLKDLNKKVKISCYEWEIVTHGFGKVAKPISVSYRFSDKYNAYLEIANKDMKTFENCKIQDVYKNNFELEVDKNWIGCYLVIFNKDGDLMLIEKYHLQFESK
jgi:hypothetical protein